MKKFKLAALLVVCFLTGCVTEEELDKLYKKLTDAGYLKVLEEMNRQLKGEK